VDWVTHTATRLSSEVKDPTNSDGAVNRRGTYHLDPPATGVAKVLLMDRVGLDRVVRKVRQHPEDHRFESQRWQLIYFPF
jgi:hypothetical protein